VYAASGGVPASNRVTDGCFINYPDVDLPSSWPTLYYKAGYPALRAVKARWDPHNVFNHRPVDRPRALTRFSRGLQDLRAWPWRWRPDDLAASGFGCRDHGPGEDP
jgi:hypothetical protein